MKRFSVVLLVILLACTSIAQDKNQMTAAGRKSLAERLGFKATDKILIVNCDDIGNSQASNAAVMDAMTNGLVTSATIMVPCPWFPEIAAYAKANPNTDFGLHLTHTAEWKGYKWGPVASKSEVPGLVDEQGYLSDPEGPFAEPGNSDIKLLDAIAAFPCLILLDEPGAGKSTELQSHFANRLYRK